MPLLWTNAIAWIDDSAIRIVFGRTSEDVLELPHGGEPGPVLAAMLRDLPVRRRHRLAAQRRLHVMTGSPWTHAAVLPWQSGIETEQAWAAYARAMLTERGLRGDTLEIAVEAAPFGRSRLGVAIETAFLSSCAEAAREAGWTFMACRDLLSAAAARYRRQLPDDCTLALVEQGVVTCLYRRAGEWADVAVQEWTQGQPIAGALAIASLICGQPAGLPAFVSSMLPLNTSVLAGLTDLGLPDVRLPKMTQPACLPDAPVQIPALAQVVSAKKQRPRKPGTTQKSAAPREASDGGVPTSLERQDPRKTRRKGRASQVKKKEPPCSA